MALPGSKSAAAETGEGSRASAEEKAIFSHLTKSQVESSLRTLCLVLLATYLTGYVFKILKDVLLPFFLALFFSVPFSPIVDYLSQFRTNTFGRSCIKRMKLPQDNFVAKVSCDSPDSRGFGICGCYRRCCRGTFACFTTGALPYGLAIIVAIVGFFALLGILGYVVYLSVAAFYESESKVCVSRFHEAAHSLADVVVHTFGYNATIFGKYGNETLTGAHLIDEITVRLEPVHLLEKSLTELTGIFHSATEIMLLLVYILIARKPEPDHTPAGDALHAPGGKKPPLISRISSSMQRYLLAKLLVACINGVLCGLLLLSFGVPLWPVFALMTVLLDFVPMIGSLLTGFLPVPFMFCKLSITNTVVCFVLLNLMQFSVGELIEPRVVGNSMEISTVVVVLGLLFFGWAWSIPGMILAVPIISIIKIVASEVNYPLGDFLVHAIEGFSKKEDSTDKKDDDPEAEEAAESGHVGKTVSPGDEPPEPRSQPDDRTAVMPI